MSTTKKAYNPIKSLELGFNASEKAGTHYLNILNHYQSEGMPFKKVGNALKHRLIEQGLWAFAMCKPVSEINAIHHADVGGRYLKNFRQWLKVNYQDYGVPTDDRLKINKGIRMKEARILAKASLKQVKVDKRDLVDHLAILMGGTKEEMSKVKSTLIPSADSIKSEDDGLNTTDPLAGTVSSTSANETVIKQGKEAALLDSALPTKDMSDLSDLNKESVILEAKLDKEVPYISPIEQLKGLMELAYTLDSEEMLEHLKAALTILIDKGFK